jgi:hypothetical protein
MCPRTLFLVEDHKAKFNQNPLIGSRVLCAYGQTEEAKSTGAPPV